MEDYEQLERIARLFQALYLAVCRLEDFYKGLNLIPSEQRFFPYLNKYQTEDNKTISFTYLYQFEGSLKFLWKAETIDGCLIVVKLAREYNADAHQLCAQKRLAPRLLCVSKPNELRKFQMIIIECVAGTVLSKKDNVNTELYLDIFNSVTSIINLLHKNNFVFGNLQPSNILVVNADGQQQTMLISFDWCGKHQVKKYPPSINNDLSLTAKPGALLNKAHDNFCTLATHIGIPDVNPCSLCGKEIYSASNPPYKEFTLASCRHIFHQKCLEKYLVNGEARCPNKDCNRDIETFLSPDLFKETGKPTSSTADITKPVDLGNQTPVDNDVTLMDELGLLGGEEQSSSKTTDKASSSIQIIKETSDQATSPIEVVSTTPGNSENVDDSISKDSSGQI
ncbi:5267_t:CDS:2 [Funneliformis caledonium]|uniref:5267_t:CDS:1 n=1 Tax=Funneliformis caledonium TaxID=1117310 RepID=A0A9N9HI40_9GLOM|nr:5267_t:CDS:2 [Funneliformis caledonium]